MENICEKYNDKCPGVKRLLREAIELAEATEEYLARPLEDNLFEWHFTVAGAEGTDFAGGLYHGRIILPQEYPMKPPDIVLLTPNGRFQVNRKICLSISGFHPETWRPSWSIRTALLALIAFMPSAAEGTIGALDYTPQERRSLARKSKGWSCEQCGAIESHLAGRAAAKPLSEEEKTLIEQMALKSENEDLKENFEVPLAPQPPIVQPTLPLTKEDNFWKMFTLVFLLILTSLTIYRRWHYIEAIFKAFL